jgi:drug/metabolite transporter (DMT)-like permease
MSSPDPVFIYGSALISNLCFGLSSVYYTEFSKKISPIWMNCIKAIVATVAFFVTIQCFYGWNEASTKAILMAMGSGLLGLCLADILLLRSYTVLGAGRTLLLFGFQPILFGVFGYILFQQGFLLKNAIAIVILMICLGLFALERRQLTGRWDGKAFAIALLAMLMDATGVLITRFVFESQPQLLPLEVNFYRALGALLGFVLLSPLVPLRLVSGFKSLTVRDRIRVIIISLTGCYLALMFYLMAVQKAHLATLSALSVFGPLSASLLECFLEKRLPSWQQTTATLLFVAAVVLVLR